MAAERINPEKRTQLQAPGIARIAGLFAVMPRLTARMRWLQWIWRMWRSHPWAACSITAGLLCLAAVFLGFGKPHVEQTGIQDVPLGAIKSIEPDSSQKGKSSLWDRDAVIAPNAGTDAKPVAAASPGSAVDSEDRPETWGSGAQSRSAGSVVWLTGEIEELPRR